MAGRNPNLDLANTNAYTCIKFGEIPSIFTQDIERKQICYEFEKNYR